MRCCKIVAWIVILSIVDFALGAPAAVREGLEMSVDVDVAEGGTATSQKRYDSSNDWSSSNAADPSTPPSPAPSDVDRFWEGVAEQHPNLFGSSPGESSGKSSGESSGESPGSSDGSVGSNWSNYASSNPESPTGSHPGSAPLPHPGLSEDRFPILPAWMVSPGTLSSTDHRPTPPQSPSSGGSPLPPLPHPGPSEDHSPSPPGFSVNPDTLSSTGHQPTPPQSPASSSPGSSEDRSPSPPGDPDKFLDDLLKGRIKRRVSGSDTVNSAQRDQRPRDPRSTNIPT
jgi:hypothetical protein